MYPPTRLILLTCDGRVCLWYTVVGSCGGAGGYSGWWFAVLGLCVVGEGFLVLVGPIVGLR